MTYQNIEASPSSIRDPTIVIVRRRFVSKHQAIRFAKLVRRRPSSLRRAEESSKSSLLSSSSLPAPSRIMPIMGGLRRRASLPWPTEAPGGRLWRYDWLQHHFAITILLSEVLVALNAGSKMLKRGSEKTNLKRVVENVRHSELGHVVSTKDSPRSIAIMCKG